MKAAKLKLETYKKFAEHKSVLAIDLRADLEVETNRCELLDAQVESLEKEKKALLKSNARSVHEYKDTVTTCFYIFWKHNKNANFSYLPPTMLEKEEVGFL